MSERKPAGEGEKGRERQFRQARKLESLGVPDGGHSEQEVTQTFVGRGQSGFVRKPYTVSTPRGAIRGVFTDTAWSGKAAGGALAPPRRPRPGLRRRP